MPRLARPKLFLASASIGAAVPFVMGADAAVPSPANAEFWRVIAELVAAGLISGVTAALGVFVAGVGAYFKTRARKKKEKGKQLLEDGDPTNDAAGERLLIEGEAELALGSKLDPERGPPG